MRSQSQDVLGHRSLSQDALGRSGRGDTQDNQELAQTQWWLSEAKRMREAAVKMRRERDRFRVAVEDAHFECRRLTAQVQELQSQLKHTQLALRESKSMADAARRELERLRQWIDEAHDESRRLSMEVHEYESQLQEARLTLDEAERSCQELKDENEDKDAELFTLREEVALSESMGDPSGQRDRFKVLQLDVEEARIEAAAARRELKATAKKLSDEKLLSSSLRGELDLLQRRLEDAEGDMNIEV